MSSHEKKLAVLIKNFPTFLHLLQAVFEIFVIKIPLFHSACHCLTDTDVTAWSKLYFHPGYSWCDVTSVTDENRWRQKPWQSACALTWTAVVWLRTQGCGDICAHGTNITYLASICSHISASLIKFCRTIHKINLLVILVIVRGYLASCVLNNDIVAVSTTHTLSSFPKHGLWDYFILLVIKTHCTHADAFVFAKFLPKVSIFCLLFRPDLLYSFLWWFPGFWILCANISGTSSSIFVVSVSRRNNRLFFLFTPPMKMEHTECSETLTYKIQTPGNNSNERIKHSQ